MSSENNVDSEIKDFTVTAPNKDVLSNLSNTLPTDTKKTNKSKQKETDSDFVVVDGVVVISSALMKEAASMKENALMKEQVKSLGKIYIFIFIIY